MFNSQGVNLGTAHGKVIITTNASDAMGQAENQIRSGVRNITASLQGIGQGMQQIGGDILKLTSPFLAFTGTGIKAASDFDASLTEIAARTGLTGDSLETVRQQALQLGADTVFSSQQAADAYLQLLTAGLDVEQAMSTLPNVLTAAAASGEDLGLTADLVTNIMSSFKLEADETATIVEALSRAAASSPATMSDLGFALQDAGGIASSFGLSVEDTAGLFAIFAQQGIRGSEAATQLRSMLAAMTSQTGKTQDVWAELGTSMFDAEGNMRNMDAILNDIRIGLDGMADEDRNRIVKQLAGSYGLVGFEALLASDGIDAMKATMDSQSSASEVAEARMGTFQGSLNSLMGSIQTLQIEALTPFMNQTLTPLIQRITDVINTVTDWVSKNPELTSSIIGVGLIVALFAGGLVVLGTVISTVTSAISTLLTAALSPLGIGLAFGAVLVTAYLNNWMGFRDWIDGTLRPAILKIIDEFKTWWGILNDIKTILDGLMSGKYDIRQVVEAAGGAIKGELNVGMPNALDNAMRNSQDIITNPDPLQAYGSIMGATLNPAGSLFNLMFPDQDPFAHLLSRDSGGPGLAGAGYMIGTGAQPEAFFPETNGTFIPNIDQILQGAGGMQIHGDIVVQANSYEEGRQAGRGVWDELERLYTGRGN